jgi:hypothetical protein
MFAGLHAVIINDKIRVVKRDAAREVTTLRRPYSGGVISVSSKSKSTAQPPHPSTAEKLAKLEERLRHELLDHEERQELRDRVLRLRRRLSR